MRIMIDTNVLISIIFFPSVQMNKLKMMLCKKNTIVLCSLVYTPAFIDKDKSCKTT